METRKIAIILLIIAIILLIITLVLIFINHINVNEFTVEPTKGTNYIIDRIVQEPGRASVGVNIVGGG
jgi:hypothetical protein